MSSESEPEELLMATRSRRPNAGNKMQKLLQQELDEVQKQTGMMAEDDINLLFAEDEEDEEFLIEPKKREKDEDMFSDSGDESSGADSDEGEREIEKQERQKRKRVQKKRNQVPVIKRIKKSPSEKQKKLQSEEMNAESLLIGSRRTSKRSSVVANKLKVYENLTLAEKRRKVIQEKLRKQREKQDLKPLTQEDRLRIAEETEKINISSLNKYKEQEVSKKQSRMAMQLREKMKFKDGESILTWISTQWDVSPLVEIEDRTYWEAYISKRDKKKKKYTRRKKADIEIANKTSENDIKEDINSNTKKLEGLLKEANDSDEVKKQDTNCSIDSTKRFVDQNTGVLINNSVGNEFVKVETPCTLNLENIESVSNQDHISNNSADSPLDTKKSPLANENEHAVDEKKELVDQSADATEKRTNPDPTTKSEDHTIKTRIEEKHISFAENDEVSLINSEDPPILVQSSKEATLDLTQPSDDYQTPEAMESEAAEPELIYEGPAQRVGKNFVMIYTFPDGPFKGQINELKTTLFGKGWCMPGNDKSEEIETIVTLKNEEGQEALQSILIPDTSILEKFPKFGEFDRKMLRSVPIETSKKDKIEIKTDAPMGVFLPNGVRKNCLITNRECKYFDPKNGVPYSDVEAIKVIQELQDYYNENGEPTKPRYQWFGFGRGGIYLDIVQRPAKGVPEGFV